MKRVVWVVLLMLGRPVLADEPPPVPVTTVVFAERPEIAKTGKVAMYKGVADDKGVAFYVEGLGINTPVAVMLVSGEAASPMRLALKNDLSLEWDRYVKAENGVAKTTFRTEGPATVLVQAPGVEKKPYQLLIWVGPEIKLHKLMKGPFIAKAEYERLHPGGPGTSSAGGGSGGRTIGVVIAAVVVVLLLVWISRRKKGAR